MGDPVPMTVTSGTDRLTPREHIEQVLARAKDRREPFRIRLPFQLYSQDERRTYEGVRDVSWNIQLDPAQTTPEGVEELIRTLGACISAIAVEGCGAVLEKLEAK